MVLDCPARHCISAVIGPVPVMRPSRGESGSRYAGGGLAAGTLLDPMWSGTLLIEAAMMATDMAPGLSMIALG